jgi:hypothetical protein
MENIFNTDIDFSGLPIPVLNPQWVSAVDEHKIIIPDNFSWSIITPDDNEDIKFKKRLISSPQKQLACGSCFAMSVATCINDVFVVSGLKWNPLISTTYLMENFNNQNKCDGGNPATLLTSIEKSIGVPSEHCVDYSWCSTNPICNLSNKGNFDSGYRKRIYLSTLITPKGCFFSKKNGTPIVRNLYRVKNVRNIGLSVGFGQIENDKLNLLLKSVIFKKGPIIMGFRVFANFTNGEFSKVNKGIYFDNAYLENNVLKFFEGTLSAPADKHACVIVGWGIEKDVQINNNGDKDDVPYWQCRNTFGKEWGDNGYFKYAMYPYNQIGSPMSIKGLGGFVAFEENGISRGSSDTINIFSKTSSIPNSFQEKDLQFYKNNEPEPSIILPLKYKIEKTNFFIILAIVLIVLTIMFQMLKK